MKISLTSWLAKRGIEKEEDLTPEEKKVFDRYKLILSGENVTVEALKEFCQSQIRLIENSITGTSPLSMLHQGALHVYLNLLKAIEAPEAEREALERLLVEELK